MNNSILYDPPEGRISFEEMQRREEKEYPYIVAYLGDYDFLPHMSQRPIMFKTWKEALAAQVKWNKECPGHRAMKRKPGILARLPYMGTV